MKSGVYKITNKVTGKFYIGSSYDIESRWICHKKNLNGNYHDNPKFQHAWNKYGENAFIFEIVEETEPTQERLFERENHYLSTLKPFERNIGYNICPKAEGGDNITHNPNRDKFIEKMLIINKGEGNGMFGKLHNTGSIESMKEKSKGRYTLEWFVERYGEKEGTEKFQNRRLMLSNRLPIINTPTERFNFKGKKHNKELGNKQKATSRYFTDHWNEFVELVKSGKYSQRQLSEMLNISRPVLKIRMKEVLNS